MRRKLFRPADNLLIERMLDLAFDTYRYGFVGLVGYNGSLENSFMHFFTGRYDYSAAACCRPVITLVLKHSGTRRRPTGRHREGGVGGVRCD